METFYIDKSQGWKNILKIIIPYFLVVGVCQLIGFYFVGLEISNYRIIQETTKQLFTIMFFSLLGKQIDRYWVMLDEKKESFNRWFNSDIYLSSKSSFDEIYQCYFINEFPSVREGKDNFRSLLENAGITQEIIDEVV